MLTMKRFFIVCVTALVVVSTAAAQSSGREMSVEESYLQESIELMIIRETSRADSRDQKQVALEYIGEAIERGNKGEDIRQALEYIGLEGVLNKARENGRLVNNYPDLRRQAAKYLGDIGSPEAKSTLLKMCLSDNEPSVLQEVIKSLGEIGATENDETIATISWIVSRFDTLNPDNMLALSAIDAFSKIAAKNNGIKDPNVVRILLRISEGGAYIPPVRERARQLIVDLRKYTVQKS